MRLRLVAETPRDGARDVSESQMPEAGLEDTPVEAAAEQWRTVAEFPDYEISNQGKLRKTIYIKTFLNSNGYLEAEFFDRNIKYKRRQKGKRMSIHRLVARAFIPNPLQLPVVNHIDGNKLNPHFENLEWVTILGNHEHAVRTGIFGRRRIPKGVEHSNSKLDPDKVRYIRLNPDRKTQRQLAAQFDVTQHAIAMVVSGETWKSVTVEATWKPPLPKGVNHGMAKLDEAKVLEIRGLLAQGVFHQTIADQYGVSRPTISMISKRRIWADLA